MILQRIKEETACAHQQLEASDLLSHFKNKTITIPDYITILAKFYCFFYPLEVSLKKFESDPHFPSDFSLRLKSEAILKDLEHFNSECKLNFCTDLPTINSINEAYGVLYVMEGSTLGARIISKILKEQLSIDENSGGKYFSGYGQNTSHMWKSFCESLLIYSQISSNDNIIIESAKNTFLRLKNWLELNNYASINN